MGRRKQESSTFETDIAQEFKDVRTAIRESNASLTEKFEQLRDEVSTNTRTFERELTKLNQNMSNVLSTLTNHELRLTQLETKHVVSETERKTVGECAKFGWFAAKFVFAAGILFGGFVGVAKAWRLIFPG